MSNHKIRYILGAGASAGKPDKPSLPVVSSFSVMLRVHGDALKSNQLANQISNNNRKMAFRKLGSWFEVIARETEKTFSIDTYARML